MFINDCPRCGRIVDAVMPGERYRCAHCRREWVNDTYEAGAPEFEGKWSELEDVQRARYILRRLLKKNARRREYFDLANEGRYDDEINTVEDKDIDEERKFLERIIDSMSHYREAFCGDEEL